MRSDLAACRQVLVFPLSFLIVGCVSTSTVMVNKKGEEINCGATGFGYIGAPAALVMSEQCKDKYKKLGYEDLRSVNKPTTYSSQSGTGLQSRNGAIKVQLPKGWREQSSESSMFAGSTYDLFVSDSNGEAFITLQALNSSIVTDWRSYFKSHRDVLAKRYAEISGTEIGSGKLAGMDSLTYEVKYKASNKMVRRKMYLLKGSKKLYLVVQWAADTKFDTKRESFGDLMKGVEYL